MAESKLASLSYAAPNRFEELTIETGPDGSVTITVPTQRSALRYVSHVIAQDLLALLLAPFAWLVFKLFATRARAVVRLTPDEFILRETSDDGLGRIHQTRTWPLAEIGELRPNRFANGLWLTITGKDSMDLLTNVPPQMIEQIGAALMQAQARVTNPEAEIS